MRSHRQSIAFLLVLWTSLSAAALVVAESERHPRTMVIDHAAGCWFELPRAKRDHGCLALGKSETVILKPGDEVAIRVANANPFFFKYKLGDNQTIEGTDLATLKEFTKNLGPIVDLISKTLKGSDDKVNALAKDSTNFSAAATSFAFRSSLPGLNDDWLRKVAKRLAAMRSLADLTPAWVERTLNPRDVEGVQSDVRLNADAWQDVRDLGDDLSSLQKLLIELNRLTAAGELVKLDAESQALVTKFLLLHGQLAEATRTRASLLEFKETVARLTACTGDTYEHCATLFLGSISQPDSKSDLAIQATDTPTPKEKSRFIGEISLRFRPYNPFKYSVGPSVVYVFAKGIGQKDVGTRAAVMLSITPRQWDFGTFSPSVQLGVTPDKDQLGLYAGLEFRLGAGLSLGGGGTRQQIKTGDESTYKWGAYMHLSYAK